MKKMNLDLDRIRIDGQTQVRLGMDAETVDAYADDYRNGTEMPPLDVFFDGKWYWLADGFHRYDAARSAELAELPCHVLEGTVDDARWFASGANKANGLRRTNADKANAVNVALMQPKGAELSDRQIAEHVGVSQQTVSSYRKKLESANKISQVPTRKGRDGKKYRTAKLGKRKVKPKATAKKATDAAPQPGGLPVLPIETVSMIYRFVRANIEFRLTISHLLRDVDVPDGHPLQAINHIWSEVDTVGGWFVAETDRRKDEWDRFCEEE